jgi:large subunit ribosomal protein L24
MSARIRKGDRVVIISGDDKGKQGKVVRVIPERGMVVVEGVNLVKKHLAATPQRPGGILEVEAPLYASKVMPLDPESGKRTRVRSQAKDGKKLRVAKSGAEIVGES